MRKRLPKWLKRGIVDTEKTRKVRKILKEKNLNTVCDSARCPNKNECYCSNVATFMILGNNCTRNCRFCSVNSSMPEPVSISEPKNVAEAVLELELEYVVITSVTRDDLEDGGAMHFYRTIEAIRKVKPECKIEILTPDFNGSKRALDIIIKSRPNVFNHNIETVKSLYPRVRPDSSKVKTAKYQRSLEVLKYIKENSSNIKTKTGVMVGLGETYEELEETFKDIKKYNVDILTIGQYIQPTLKHYDVDRYLDPEEFEKLRNMALEIGIKEVISTPLARSSYHAKESYCNVAN